MTEETRLGKDRADSQWEEAKAWVDGEKRCERGWCHVGQHRSTCLSG